MYEAGSEFHRSCRLTPPRPMIGKRGLKVVSKPVAAMRLSAGCSVPPDITPVGVIFSIASNIGRTFGFCKATRNCSPGLIRLHPASNDGINFLCNSPSGMSSFIRDSYCAFISLCSGLFLKKARKLPLLECIASVLKLSLSSVKALFRKTRTSSLLTSCGCRGRHPHLSRIAPFPVCCK